MLFRGKLTRSRIVCSLLILTSACFWGCRRAIVAPTAAAVDEATQFVREVPEKEPLYLPSDTTEAIYDGLIKKKSLVEFYQLSGNKPAWENNHQSTGLGDSMVLCIQNIRYYGLLPQNYHAAEIGDLNLPSPTDVDLLRRDLLLTDAFLMIASDLKYGRLSPRKEKADDSLNFLLLRKVLQEGGISKNLERQEPLFEGYRSLKQGLRKVLDSAGMSDRKMLMQGVTIGSIPVHKEVQNIEINMERWRWDNNKLADRYILINIPSFMLTLYSKDSALMESRVIVGKPDHPTPVLSSVIQCFITYPYWHVPRKISVQELLPIIRKDSSYLSRNNFDVLDKKGRILDARSVDWNSFSNDYFPVSLRQREGVDNSLGVIKFVFDNPYAVFLHDTNAKRLFGSGERAFSHGCIRMEKAVDLAHYLVTGEIGKESKMVTKHLREKIRHTIDVPIPIPIHVRYFTAEYKRGRLDQYRDLYQKDQALINRFYYPGNETPIREEEN